MRFDWPEFKQILVDNVLSFTYVENDRFISMSSLLGSQAVECEISKPHFPSWAQDFTDNFKAQGNIVTYDAMPFAKPTSRLDADAIELCTAPIGITTSSDKTIEAERQIHGGDIIYSNWQLGDWIDIQIVHPTLGVVGQYVKKKLLGPLGIHTLDTRPLVATIQAGLIIRVNYHAVNSGEPRIFGVNLDLYEEL